MDGGGGGLGRCAKIADLAQRSCGLTGERRRLVDDGGFAAATADSDNSALFVRYKSFWRQHGLERLAPRLAAFVRDKGIHIDALIDGKAIADGQNLTQCQSQRHLRREALDDIPAGRRVAGRGRSADRRRGKIDL